MPVARCPLPVARCPLPVVRCPFDYRDSEQLNTVLTIVLSIVTFLLQLTSQDLDESIEKETSGDLEKGFLALGMRNGKRFLTSPMKPRNMHLTEKRKQEQLSKLKSYTQLLPNKLTNKSTSQANQSLADQLTIQSTNKLDRQTNC